MELLYKLNKTPDDINMLVAENKKLVYYMLNLKKSIGNPDAESAAFEALWDAVNLFDVYSTTAFSTYACKLIGNAINDVYRRNKAIYLECELTEFIPDERVDIHELVISSQNVKVILKIFDEYISTLKGTARNILLVWYSSDFSASNTMIASICKTSTSYVTRAQDMFRCYCRSKLKKS